MSNYEHPFELNLVVGIDPKQGFEVSEVGDHIFLTRGVDWSHYDLREVTTRLNDVLRELTARDDAIAWQVRFVKLDNEKRGE